MRLKERVAIVTGAGNGIGRHIALAFAREGASVLIVDVKAEGNAETVRQVDAAVGEGHAGAVCLDIGEPENVRTAVAACIERFGRLDCIVNNAANPWHAVLQDVNPDSWDRMYAVNVRATVLFAQAALPYITEHPGGSLVNISSVRATLTMPAGLAYDSSKAAVLGLTRTLAVDLGQAGVRVNAICPGHIMSFGEEEWKRGRSERDQELMRMPYPLHRVGRPEEIASAAVFLASDEASFITGQALYVDGGLSVMNPETAIMRAAEQMA